MSNSPSMHPSHRMVQQHYILEDSRGAPFNLLEHHRLLSCSSYARPSTQRKNQAAVDNLERRTVFSSEYAKCYFEDDIDSHPFSMSHLELDLWNFQSEDPRYYTAPRPVR